METQYYKTKSEFKAAYAIFCDKAHARNFAYEAYNWASYCIISTDNITYLVTPNKDKLCIQFKKLD